MLVLSRRIGQTLLIGEDVTLTVLSISRRQVRIGVQADRNIHILREELEPKDAHRFLQSESRPKRE